MAFTSRSYDETAEALMDRQTKFAFAILAVLIAFVVLLFFFGHFSGWYESGY